MHPTRNQQSLAFHDDLQQRQDRPLSVTGFGEVTIDCVEGQAFNGFHIAARREILKGPDPDVTRCDASSTAPGNWRSRITVSPVETAASALVVGIPSACIASLTRYSRRTGPNEARTSRAGRTAFGPHPSVGHRAACRRGLTARQGGLRGRRQAAKRNCRIDARHTPSRSARRPEE